MNRDQDKPKWWRPRWSVKMLLIVVTLVCTYLACWKTTATQGTIDVVNHGDAKGRGGASYTASPVPFVVAVGEWDGLDPASTPNISIPGVRQVDYFWMFGAVTRLSSDKR